MAFRHGKHGDVSVDGTSLTAYCDSQSLSISNDTAETSVFGISWKTFLEGMASGEFEIGGNYDPTATTGPADKLFGLIGGGAVTVILYPGGNDTGQQSYSASCILTAYNETSGIGDAVKFTASFQVTGAVTQAAV